MSQGDVVDRSRERLGWSDRGMIMLRKMYMQAIQDVQEGREPKGIRRDAAADPVITLPPANTIVAATSS